jgi:hypothetical protein
MIGALIGGWIYQVAIGFNTPDADEINKYEVVATSNRELQPLTGTGKGYDGNSRDFKRQKCGS